MTDTSAIRATMLAKCQPGEYSPKFRALVEYLAEAPGSTNPTIVGLSVTSDGYLIGRLEYRPGYRSGRQSEGGAFLGAADDLARNLQEMLGAADYVTARETLLRNNPRLDSYYDDWR